MPAKKIPQKRGRKPVKPPIKTPSRITIKIGNSDPRPLKIERHVTTVRKIELANEVALAQLVSQPGSFSSPVKTSKPEGQTPKKPPIKLTLVKRKHETADVDSLDEFEAPAPKKKKPGPKSKTIIAQIKKTNSLLEPVVLLSNGLVDLKKKIPTPVKKAKKTPARKRIVANKSSNASRNENSGISEASANAVATPPKQRKAPAKRCVKKPPEKTPVKRKGLNAKEIKAAALMLENALENMPQQHSRPNSVISNKSNLSWTKDISTESSFSSGTTTCVTVTSKDFVRFDNKIPLVKLEHLKPQKLDNGNIKQLHLSEMSKSDSSSSNSSSSSSDSELDGTNSKPDINLSTSSLTPQSPLSDMNTELFGQEMENLNNLLKNFYADLGKLVPHHDDHPCTFSDIIEVADRELSDLLHNCENFDRDFKARCQQQNSPETSGNYHRTAYCAEQNKSKNRDTNNPRRTSNEDNSSYTSSPERYTPQNDSDGQFVKPCPVKRVSVANTRDTSANVSNKNPVFNQNHQETTPADRTSNNYVYVPFDQSHDDEDALSLYAESITGVESSRLDSASVSNVSLQDVYVPKYSPKTQVREKYVYRPTKIQELNSRCYLAEGSVEEGEIISNADDREQGHYTRFNEMSGPCVTSSVTHMNADTNNTAMELDDTNRKSSFFEESRNRVEARTSSQLRRLFSSYQKMNPIKSSLYRGYCFFYIASQCKYNNCRFPHVDIDSNTFKCRLTVLNEDNLISEYLLMCSHMRLKRKYCLLFVEECSRRKATRTLFEMAIELGLGIVEVDPEVRAQVLETALLYLNTVSLDACDDLLKVEHRETMLCDALLQCMANSQNFAQFKSAFAKLAHLTCELRRPVEAAVAGSILERVVILPGEEVLARGMLALMQNAGGGIFRSRLADDFEQQLAGLDGDALEVYLRAKEAARGGPEAPPATAAEGEPALREGARHASPDSTNPETLPDSNEPIFTRTINNEVIRDLFKPPTYPVPKRFVAPLRPQWRGRGGYNMRVLQRGRFTRGSSGRSVYTTQKGFRNGTNI